MPIKGQSWDNEYRKKYFSSDKVRENLERFKITASKPKSEEQKEKMRLAKLNVPKSEEHKQAMSIAHKRRQEIAREIKELQPDISLEVLWDLVKEKYHA